MKIVDSILIDFNNNHVIQDFDRKIVVKYFPQVFQNSQIRTLQQSTESLLSSYKGKSCKGKRNLQFQHYFGCSKDCSPQIYVLNSTKNPFVLSWIHQNQELFNTANTIFKSNFPQLFEEYSKVLLPNRFFGAWAAITLNKLFDTGMSYHIDKQDYKKGYC